MRSLNTFFPSHTRTVSTTSQMNGPIKETRKSATGYHGFKPQILLQVNA